MRERSGADGRDGAGRAVGAGAVGAAVGVDAVRATLQRTDAAPEWRPDGAQQGVVDHPGGPLLVLGGAGTGKTATLVGLVSSRVAAGEDPRRILVLTGGAQAAASLRDTLATAVRRATREPVARTFHSFALAVLEEGARAFDLPAPRPVPATEQDAMVRELLVGDVRGVGGVRWPASLGEALTMRGFAQELRDFMQRWRELDLDPGTLAALGERHVRPEWRAVAAFIEQYDQVLGLRTDGGGVDRGGLVSVAADALEAEPDLLRSVRDRIDAVLVDDYQDVGPAQERLLRLVAGGGRTVIAFADPDQAVDAFRGAQQDVVHRFRAAFRPAAGGPTPLVVLRTDHRQAAAPAEARRAVVARLPGSWPHRHPGGTADGPDRSAAARQEPGSVVVQRFATGAAELAGVAGHLHRLHAREGLRWSSCAVVVRGGPARLSAVRRALVAAGIPAVGEVPETGLAEQPGVQPLLTALTAVADPTTITTGTATDLLLGPIGAVDPATWQAAVRRRATLPEALVATLRRATDPGPAVTAGSDAATTRGTTGIPSLVGAPADPAAAFPSPVRGGVRRLVRTLHAGSVTARRPDADVLDTLWSVWSSSGLPRRWERRALDGLTGAHEQWRATPMDRTARRLVGRAAAAAADRDLDAVMALFGHARQFAHESTDPGTAAFLAHVRRQRLRADQPRLGRWDAVSVVTAHAARGRSWDCVAIVGLQEGLWPDLRPRGTVLGIEEALAAAAGSQPQPETVVSRLADERRLFALALGRAARHLLLTAVDSEEEQPSRFLAEASGPSSGADGGTLPHPRQGEDTGLLPAPRSPGADDGRHAERARAGVPGNGHGTPDVPADPTDAPAPAPQGPAELVADLRRAVSDPASPTRTRTAAARHLARLALAGFPGADPDCWWGLAEMSGPGPVRDPDEPVRVSPSRVATYLDCPLRWFLDQAGARAPASSAQQVGNAVHAVAEEAAQWFTGGAVPLEVARERARRALAEHLAASDLPDGWVGRRERDRAAQMVDRLVTWLAGRPPGALVGVEVPFVAWVGGAEVRGVVDRLERDDQGRAVVVDYKTGSSLPTKEGARRDPQLATYQLAAEHGAFAEQGVVGSGGATIVGLGSGERGPALRDQQALGSDHTWAADLLAEVAVGMAGAAFTATVGAACRTCPVTSLCPLRDQGRQVTR